MADMSFVNRCLNSDVIVFYRCYHEKTPFIQKLVSLNKLVIYDIDDYVFQENGRFNSEVERKLIYKYLDIVNCYTATTKVLLDQMPKNGVPRFVRENCIDNKTVAVLTDNKKTLPKTRFRIGWTVGINRREMQEFAKQFLKILNNLKMDFEFWYFGKTDDFYKYTKKLKYVHCNRLNYIPTNKWKQVYKTFALADFDVVINPLEENDIFFHCKSPIKFFEMGMLRVPLIVSRVHPFTDMIEDGVNGYFASTPKEFVDQILRIKNHPKESKELVDKVVDIIREKYLVPRHARKFIDNCLWAMEVLKKNNKKMKVRDEYVLDNDQGHFGHVTGPILKPLIHEFRCSRPGLCRLEFLGSTFNAKFDMPLKMIVKNKNSNAVIHERVYNTRDLPNDDWWGFEFSPIPESNGHDFEVTFIPIEPTPNKTIQFYLTLKKHNDTGFFIGGIKRDGYLAFKSYCSSYVHALPSKRKKIIKESAMEIPIKEVTQYVPADNNKINNKILIKKRGNISDLLMLTPVTQEMLQDRHKEIYVATNQQHIFIDNCGVSGTIDWASNMSGVSQRFLLDHHDNETLKEHPINVYGRVLLGHNDFKKDIIINVKQSDIEKVDRILRDNKLNTKEFIVFHQGLVPQNRLWPVTNWKRLEAHCIARGYRVVVVGSGSDFISQMSQSVNLVNRLTVAQSKYLLDRSKLLVCIDGDYLQIAGATQIPVICLFMGTLPQYRLPYRKDVLGANCYPITASIDCCGCVHESCLSSRNYGCKYRHLKCQQMITPKMVLERIESL